MESANLLGKRVHNMGEENSSLSQYLRLYGVRLVEQKVSYELVLRVRIAATQFVTSTLPDDLTRSWLRNPQEGVAIAQDAMQPQLEALRTGRDEELWQQLGLNIPNPRFADYWANRPNLSAQHMPVLNQSIAPRRLTPLLPTNRLSTSLVTAQRILDATYSAIIVVDAARQLWQNWQKGKEETRILEARRVLLEDALRVTEASQNHALQQALDPQFVENYLLESGDHSTYDALFGEIADEDNN